MYGILEGEPFQVYARRESVGAGLMIRFECKEGMGILGIRKSGRTDPAPVAAYEEEDIDPASLRAGRFVHVLVSGQRQSYALSRISAEVAARVPNERWVELKPHTEYGFRYLVVPEDDLDGTVASVAVGMPRGATAAPAEVRQAAKTGAVASVPAAPDPARREADRLTAERDRDAALAREARIRELERAHADRASAPPAPERVSNPPQSSPPARPVPVYPPIREVSVPLPPPQTPMSPVIAEAALKLLSKEQAVEQLKVEMMKVHRLQSRVSEVEDALLRAKQHERDLIELLARWNQQS